MINSTVIDMIYTLSRLLWLGLVLTIAACQNAQSDADSDKSKDKSEKEITTIPVEISEVIVADISDYYNTTGTLSPVASATVVAQASGLIKDILVEEGAVVTANQALARLDAKRLTLDAAKKQTEVGMLKNQLARSKTLYSKGVVSQDEYEQQQLEMQAKQTDLDMALLDLQYTTLRAPIAGVITKRYIKPGNILNENEQAFDIAQFISLEMILEIPEMQFSRLQVNQQANLTIDALERLMFKGYVKRISPGINPQTGTFQVVIGVDNASNQLKPGLFARVSINLATHKDSLLIPREAVVVDQGQTIVFTVDQDTAIRKEVTTGFRNDRHVEIVDGLQQNDQVVVIGQSALKDQTPVTVVNQPI